MYDTVLDHVKLKDFNHVEECEWSVDNITVYALCR